MLRCLDENKNNYSDIRVFEIGRVVSGLDSENMAIENKKLAVLLASQKKSETELFFEMKTLITDVAKNLMGVDIEIAEGETVPYLHPVNSFRIKSRTDDYGYLGILHPETNKLIDKRFKVCMLEIDFEKLANTIVYSKKIKQVSKYQAVEIDYNILVDENLKYHELVQKLAKFRMKIVNGYELIDIYQNKDVLGDKKSVTLRFNLSSMDHTLSGEEIDNFRKEFEEYIKRVGLEIRG